MARALRQIIKHSKEAVERRKRNIPEEWLIEQINAQPLPKDFAAGIEKRGISIIAEIKRSAPRFVEGKLQEAKIYDGEASVTELAADYQRNGAECLSVVTKEKWFDGSLANISKARRACSLPILRKDFIVDPWQILEARAAGADAVLLIMAALSLSAAREMEELAHKLGMATLAEVHEPEELETACRLRTRLIGVNNRNLKTMEINLETTKTISGGLPKDKLLISESGISRPEHINKLREYGADGLLIGRALMETDSPGATLKRLIAESGI